MVDFAEAAFECADPAHAAALFKQLEPWADQLPATGGSALGPVSHYLGGLTTVLGRYDEADAYFARSADVRSDGCKVLCRSNGSTVGPDAPPTGRPGRRGESPSAADERPRGRGRTIVRGRRAPSGSLADGVGLTGMRLHRHRSHRVTYLDALLIRPIRLARNEDVS